ncbi:glycosyltransferase family 39 protein [Acetonema longum]|uniref:Hypothetical membrane protein n=1 Tax=Acetonema longum DSM 6540 TaxID=1009370 RepID=F7NKI8_9FIRM|nr:glycosyltransferase family 39 protein [Acetonema longum]EGO63440.1 hypothetical membrane protein [Acetonema longum DSM 6540]
MSLRVFADSWSKTTGVMLLLILGGLLFRVVLGLTIGLGVDESYAVAVSRIWTLSYFDHPPLHFWLIGLAGKIFGTDYGILLRLPFILLFAATTWLMYRLGAVLFGNWAGVYAALIMNLSAVFSLSTGGWILPDGPLMFFMLACVLVLVQLLFDPTQERSLFWWLAAGVLLGLGLLSKYHAVFIAFGAFLFIITSRTHRPLLLTAGPYLALGIGLLIFSPVLIWNWQHDWASFAFQGSRGLAKGWYPGRMMGNIAGQAAWVLPWIWLPLVGSWITSGLGGPGSTPEQSKRWFLSCLAAGPILIFTFLTLCGAEGLFHWQAPGYLFLFPLLGRVVANRLACHNRKTAVWLRLSALVFILLIAVLASHTATGWLKTMNPSLFPQGDPSMEAYDWREVRPAFAAKGFLTQEHQAELFVIAPHWIDAGKIDYALSGKLPVVCLSDEPHHFAFIRPIGSMLGKDAVIIGRPAVTERVLQQYGPYFQSISPLGSVAINRQGREELRLNWYYARNLMYGYPMPYGH